MGGGGEAWEPDGSYPHVIMGNSPVFFCLMGAGGQQDTCHTAKTKGCVDLSMSCDYYHKAGEMRRSHRTLSAFLRSLGKARCSSQGPFGLQQWSPAFASNQSSPAALSTHKSSKDRRLKAEWCFGLILFLLVYQDRARAVAANSGSQGNSEYRLAVKGLEWAPRPLACLEACGPTRSQSKLGRGEAGWTGSAWRSRPCEG